MSRRPVARVLRLVPAPALPAEVPELLIYTDAPEHSLVLDAGGGKPLASLELHEAMRVLRTWWTAQHAAYWRQQLQQVRR